MSKITVKDQAEIRDDMLRSLKYGLERRGIANPNVGPNSDFYVEFTAVANEIAVVEANAIIASEAAMDDSATGDDLIRRASFVGLSLRPAVGSRGVVIGVCSVPGAVPYQAQLLDQYGQRYEVTAGGTYANGALIPIQALATGDKTNRPASEVFKWVSPPPYFDSKASVGLLGLRYGADVESPEELRQRLFTRKRVPPRSGNETHVIQLAEEASDIIQTAFVYPALQGAGTVHVAVTSRVTETNKNRDIDATYVSTVVAPYISGKMPEHTQVVTTTVQNVSVSLGVSLSIPDSVSASPPGDGGGWIDGTPWPPPGARVTALVSTTDITITTDAATLPFVGTSVSWVSPLTWTSTTAKIVTVLVISSTVTRITLDTPFVGITVGAGIGPGCQNVEPYLQTVLSYFELIGPGEKTANAALLTRSKRFPPPRVQWPYTLNDKLLKALTFAHDEVSTATYAYRLVGGLTQTTPNPTLGAITDAPCIFVPGDITFSRPTS